MWSICIYFWSFCVSGCPVSLWNYLSSLCDLVCRLVSHRPFRPLDLWPLTPLSKHPWISLLVVSLLRYVNYECVKSSFWVRADAELCRGRFAKLNTCRTLHKLKMLSPFSKLLECFFKYHFLCFSLHIGWNIVFIPHVNCDLTWGSLSCSWQVPLDPWKVLYHIVMLESPLRPLNTGVSYKCNLK